MTFLYKRVTKSAQDIDVIIVYDSRVREALLCTIVRYLFYDSRGWISFSLSQSLDVNVAPQCTGSYARFYPINPLNIDNSIKLYLRVYCTRNTVEMGTDSGGLVRHYVG